MTPNFIIGGVIIPLKAALQFSQSYSPKIKQEANAEDALLANCTTVRQTCSASGINGKLITRINGTGWIPAAMAGLNWNRPIMLECITPRHVFGSTNVINITPKRRAQADYAPIGYAIVDGDIVETTISMSTDEATLGVISGADGYLVQYTPKFNVLAEFSDAYDMSGNRYSWSLQGEEV